MSMYPGGYDPAITVEEAQALFAATRVLSYRVFFFTLYSMGCV